MEFRGAGNGGVAENPFMGDIGERWFRYRSALGVDADVGIDGNGRVGAEETIEAIGDPRRQDGGPAVAGVVLRTGAERGVEAGRERDNANGASAVGAGGGASNQIHVLVAGLSVKR